MTIGRVIPQTLYHHVGYLTEIMTGRQTKQVLIVVNSGRPLVPFDSASNVGHANVTIRLTNTI